MPLHDVCQPAVERALIKDGWVIIDTQVYIAKGDFYIYVDLEAEKEVEQTFIEVKCFTEGVQNEFYVAVGQYIAYRNVIRTQRPRHTLYLAIPADVYAGFSDAQREILIENRVKLIVVDLKLEAITQWIE